MQTAPITLERAFLRRQFRSIRGCLVGKQVTKIISPTILPPPKSVDSISTINESKKILNYINKYIDILKSKLTKTSHTPTPTTPVISTDSNIASQTSLAKSRKRARLRKLRPAIFGGIVLMCLTLLVVLFAPTIYYTLFPGDPVPVKADESGTPLGGAFANGTHQVVNRVPDPPYDANLPDGNWLIIPKIGVDTQILESATPDESLNKGVWRVPDFGTPGDPAKPMILAAHRFGWKAWWENGNQYWRYHSFYLLPDLKPGDLIEVISNKRKYTYEVYAGEQGEEISDYNADLILYTCKFLDSPLRYFRYARLVDPSNPDKSPTQTTNSTSSPSATPQTN